MNLDTDILIYEQISQKLNDKNFQDELATVAKEIVKNIEELLHTKATDFGLVSTNSVRKDYYFNVVSRVKKPDSLKEKLVRKNLGLYLIEELKLVDPSDIEINNDIILAYLRRFEDIIGIKIITELLADTENVYNLLSDNKTLLDDKQIDFKDFSPQPRPMQNGFKIYNIKAKYKGKYCFELQIKSKISSAWGDMDHTLFYKDYTITPIKDSNQIAMNNIGELLNKLESFLLDIRNTNINYKERSEYLYLISKFDNEISSLIKKELGIYYNLNKIADILLFIYKKLGGKQDSAPIQQLCFSQLKYTADSSYCNYINIRQKSYELMILEVIFCHWNDILKSLPNTEENYNKNLGTLIGYLNHYVSNTLKSKAQINNTLKILPQYCQIPEIWLDKEAYIEIDNVCQRVTDLFAEDEETKKILSHLIPLYGIVVFSGNLKAYVNNLLKVISTDQLIHFMNIIKNHGMKNWADNIAEVILEIEE